MLSFFKRRHPQQYSSLTTDLHSHLLPGLDDGVTTVEQAEEIIHQFQQLGYTRMITTPHVMSDTYRNTTGGIREKLRELNAYLLSRGNTIQLEAAAEYYLDEQCMAALEKNEDFLTFGNKYLLFETNFLTEPLQLKNFIFQLLTKSYKPVLAHPERYMFIQNDLKKAEDLIDRGVYFQINISSITGYYSREAQTTVQKLIDRGWVHFLGSDCHHLQQANLVRGAQSMKYFQKALSLPLLNNSI